MKIKYLSVLKVASAALFIACAPAIAQWQTPNHSVPIGRGSGTGFKSVGPGDAGTVLSGNGASADPTFKTPAAIGVPQVPIEAFGGGCAVTDNTAALVAAVASTGSGPVRVLFNGNCNYTFTQADALVFSKFGVWLQGAGLGVTGLKYMPSADGTFLHWKAPIANAPIFNGGIRDISIFSHNYTYAKTAIKFEAVSGFVSENVSCGLAPDYPTNPDTVWGGGTGVTFSTCLNTNGWEFAIVRNFRASADNSIRISLNPNNSYFSTDHFHFEDLYLQNSNAVAGTFPNVIVDPGVIFTDATLDGHLSMTHGKGFYWNDTAAFSSVTSVNTAGSNYAVGDLITVAGGTCSTAPRLRVISVTGGGVTFATIAEPGVCTVNPSNPVSQASTTGSGSGGTFTLASDFSYNLSISNARTEIAEPADYSFYIAPKNKLYQFTLRNSTLSTGMNGIFLKNVSNARIENNNALFSTALEFLNATSANGNDMISLSNNRWGVGATVNTTGMCKIWDLPSPTNTSTTLPPSGLYASSICGINIYGGHIDNTEIGVTTPASVRSTNLIASAIFRLDGVGSPAQITSNQNNYTAGGSCSALNSLRLSTDASRTISGFSCSQQSGWVLVINNVGSNNLVLTNEDSNSTDVNRFAMGGDKTIAANTSATFRYDSTSQRWRPVANIGLVDLASGVTGRLPLANLAQGSALSVLGVTGNATADNASIAAASDNQVMRRSGAAIAFGAVNLASSSAVTGSLALANGGCGGTNAATCTAALNAMVGDSGSGGTKGLVPAPAAGDASKFLRGDGSFATPAGTVSANSLVAGRITLQTGTPVMSTSQSGKTTVYWTPYKGQQAPLWDGSVFVLTDMGGELSQATTDTTKSPAAVGANSNYDVFLWDDTGTKRATRGPAWSSGTSRGTGAGTTELEFLNGFWVNKNAITNGPAARKGLYVGTIASDASSQINYTFGSSASGGGAAILGVWNTFNRVSLKTTVTDSTASWTYSTNTIRALNGSNGNRVTFVSGLAEDGLDVTIFNTTDVSGGVKSYQLGMALNSTTAFDKMNQLVMPTLAGTIQLPVGCSNSYAPLLGLNFIQALENAAAGSPTPVGGAFEGLVVRWQL